MREKFESSLSEENFLRFFYTAEDNHITPRAATLWAIIYSQKFSKKNNHNLFKNPTFYPQ